MIHCQCDNVLLEVIDKPIMAVACYCDDCQEAGEKLTSLRNADPNAILEADGGTRFLMQRTDRIRCIKGAEFLSEYKLKLSSTSRRVIATCCNTPMFLEFEKGHLVTLTPPGKGFIPGKRMVQPRLLVSVYCRKVIHRLQTFKLF